MPVLKSQSSQQLSDSERELNRIWWEKRGQVNLEDYSYERQHHGGTLQDDIERFPFLDAGADHYARNAFYLLMSGHEKEGRQAAERAIRVAQEALRLKRFFPIFADEVRHTSPYRELEIASGQSLSFRWWHYGLWFSTGERSIDILQQAAAYQRQYYDLSQAIKAQDLATLLTCYVEAEMFDEVLEVFRRDYRGKTARPLGAQFSRSTERTLAVVAEFAAGDQELEIVARKAIEFHFQKALKWHVRRSGMTWCSRLHWAWLRGKHFTGTTELPPLLKELRGL